MNNEKESVISVQSEYIERKKEELKQAHIGINEGDNTWNNLEKFFSDMAQEIFGALPKEIEFDESDYEGEFDDCLDATYNGAWNSCRSTFLKNIKKLK